MEVVIPCTNIVKKECQGEGEVPCVCRRVHVCERVTKNSIFAAYESVVLSPARSMTENDQRQMLVKAL